MISLTVNKSKVKEDIGKVYVIKMVLRECDTVVYKVGVTQRKASERMFEILSSFFNIYRYVPECSLKRHRGTTDIYGKEALMHKALDKYRYKSDNAFSGHTELFTGVDEIWLL